jgi:hypothetical protein
MQKRTFHLIFITSFHVLSMIYTHYTKPLQITVHETLKIKQEKSFIKRKERQKQTANMCTESWCNGWQTKFLSYLLLRQIKISNNLEYWRECMGTSCN